MNNHDLTECRAFTLQTLKSLVALTLTLPAVMVLVSAILVGAIGSVTGQSGIEVALTFMGDAIDPALMALLKFTLPIFFFIIVIYSIISLSFLRMGALPGIYFQQLTVRFQTRIIGLAKLWASLVSAVAGPLSPQHTPNRRIRHWMVTALHPLPYLAGEAPQLE